ncbi:MAG: DUF4387 family protein [Flavobacteriales bacterium]|jgi:hypothetical protein|uniref:DUF4387 family protein n=1 Tax=uncultured Planktomarina sp. TaxID=1538529 RepID=UPI0030A84147|tara:strand:- start:2020 stop:2322 length:303 start_codon:yes stop_codon:yes gene_type:complete
MTKLGDIVPKIRSKNAGPFWLTIDIFCVSPELFTEICERLSTQSIADGFGIPLQAVKRFEIQDLNTIKISLPRPTVQGVREDRDMHGASFSQVLKAIELR